MHGHRWHFQRGAPEASTLRDFVVVGVSEGFTHEISPGAGGLAEAPGDYLYYDGNMDYRQEGTWGLFRVFDMKTDEVQPLPDRTAPAEGPGYFETQKARTLTENGRPPKADAPANIGPADAPPRM